MLGTLILRSLPVVFCDGKLKVDVLADQGAGPNVMSRQLFAETDAN